jgi:hypothetical protein
MMCLAPSCRATLLNFLWRQTSGCPKKFASPQLVQWASRSPARVMTTDKNGQDGVPQLFSRWAEHLRDWGVVVKDDAGMEEEFERLTEGEVERDADPKAGQKLRRMWALLPKIRAVWRYCIGGLSCR